MNEISLWFWQHWFQVLQSLGIIGSLVFTGIALRNSLRAQRVTNLFQLTQFHRQLYSELFDRGELRRIFQKDVDLNRAPVTENERLFLTFAVLHFSLALEAMQNGAIIPIEGLEKDAASFFSLPIPFAVWTQLRPFQNNQLVEVMDRIVPRIGQTSNEKEA